MQRFLIALAVLVGSFMALLLILRLMAKPPEKLGVHNGRLGPCPSSPNCVSSQSDDGSHYLSPWAYQGDRAEALAKLVAIVTSLPRTKIVRQTEDYIHAEFTTNGIPRWTDDVEFYLPADEQVVHFRSSSRIGYSDWGKNRKRMEAIQQRFAP